MCLLVPFIRGEIQDDPDIYPAIRSLVGIKLAAINGKHQNHVVFTNLAFLYIFKIVASIEKIIVS